MSIQEHLNKIRNAIKGSEVRESIAKGIETAYDDASEKDNANMEVKIARGTNPNLNTRLNKMDEVDKQTTARLAQKLSKGNVQKSDYDLSKDINLWNINDFDENTRQTFLEAQNIDVNYILGTGNVKNENLSDRSVDLDKTSFATKGKNLFDGRYEAAFIGGNIQNGAVYYHSTTGSHRSAVIRVDPDVTYTVAMEAQVGDRFRIAVSQEHPQNNEYMSRYVKEEEVGANKVADGFSCFTFTTEPSEKYLVVYVSTSSNEPKLQVEESDDFTGYSPHTIHMLGKVHSPDEPLEIGKNLFDGNYVRGTISGAYNTGAFINSANGRLAIVSVYSGQSYAISKTDSNRFRVAVSRTYPGYNKNSPELGTLVRRLTPDEYDSRNEAVITVPEGFKYLIVYVAFASGSETPETPYFMQIEQSDSVTEWETYGYRLKKEAKPYRAAGFIKDRVKDGKVYVSDFEGDGKNDTQAIQDAFDYAEGHIVVFEPKLYTTNSSVTALAHKVRGISGQNALVRIDGADEPVIKYIGSKEVPSANPNASDYNHISMTEMNPFIRNLRVTSAEDSYSGVGIYFEGTYGLLLEACSTFGLRTGIEVGGINRNFIIANSHIQNNALYGIHWNKTDVHQQNLIGNHISYNLKSLFIENSDIYNLQVTGNDIEGAYTGHHGSQSLFHVYLDDVDGGNVQEVIITGNTLQDHTNNQLPLLFFESKKSLLGIKELIIGDNHIGNSKEESIWLEGVSRAVISGNSILSSSLVEAETSIKMAGRNQRININGNNLSTGIEWSEQTTQSLIANNITEGFSLPDSNNGTVRAVGNV